MAGIKAMLADIPEEFTGLVVSMPASELAVVSAKSISNTTELHLGGKGIQVLWGFDTFVNLEELWVNNNKLTELVSLDALVRLQRLYAHNNNIRSLADSSLPCFKFLRELNLSHNKLASLDKTLDVLERFQFLEHLELHGNPAAEEPNYKLAVIHRIPSLRVFDRHVITDAERDAARRKFGRRSLHAAAGAGASGGTGRDTRRTAASNVDDTPVQRMLRRDVARVKQQQAAADAAARKAMFSGVARMTLAPDTVPVSGAMSGTRSTPGLLDTMRGVATTAGAVGGVAAPPAGVLGEWELYRLRKIFTDMDADSSGTWSRDELRAGLKRGEDLGFKLVAGTAPDALFDALDADGNDAISWKEFLSGALGELELEHPDTGERVEPLQFVTLDAEEAQARSDRYVRQAAGVQRTLLQLADSDARRGELSAQAMELSTKAGLLQDLADCQKGRFAPPAPLPPAVAPRSDVVDFISVLPRKEALRVAGKATTDTSVPRVGEESDSDTDDEDGKLFGADVEAYRQRRKARKPRAVVKSTLQLPGSRALR